MSSKNCLVRYESVERNQLSEEGEGMQVFNVVDCLPLSFVNYDVFFFTVKKNLNASFV